MRVWYWGKHEIGRFKGDVGAFVTHPDGKTFFRVADKWFPADMCELVE